MPENMKIRIKLDHHHAAKPSTEIDPKRVVKVSQQKTKAKISPWALSILFASALSFWAIGHFTADDATQVAETESAELGPDLVTVDDVILPAPVVNTQDAAVIDNKIAPVTEVKSLRALQNVMTPLSPADKKSLVTMVEVQLKKTISKVPEPILANVVEQSVDTVDTVITKVESQYVSRAQLTTAIHNREPVDKLSQIVYANRNITRLYFFTEIQGMRGKVVSHRWEHKGKVMATVRFRIGSDRWRTYSSKYINQAMLGGWKVVVIGNNSKILHVSEFQYSPSDSQSAAL